MIESAPALSAAEKTSEGWTMVVTESPRETRIGAESARLSASSGRTKKPSLLPAI